MMALLSWWDIKISNSRQKTINKSSGIYDENVTGSHSAAAAIAASISPPPPIAAPMLPQSLHLSAQSLHQYFCRRHCCTNTAAAAIAAPMLLQSLHQCRHCNHCANAIATITAPTPLLPQPLHQPMMLPQSLHQYRHRCNCCANQHCCNNCANQWHRCNHCTDAATTITAQMLPPQSLCQHHHCCTPMLPSPQSLHLQRRRCNHRCGQPTLTVPMLPPQ